MSLKIDQLEIIGKENALLAPLSVQIDAGEILTLMGPSGIGKSTILAAIAGHISPNFTLKGRVILNEEDILGLPMEKRKIGVLFQDPLLFPHLNTAQNLLFALPKATPNKKQTIERALEAVGLSGFDKRDPATLSGGEAARVALQRTLLAEPDALLLDEPFSKLDETRRDDIRALTFAQIQEKKIPAILVTHDINDAQATGGKILNLSAEL